LKYGCLWEIILIYISIFQFAITFPGNGNNIKIPPPLYPVHARRDTLEISMLALELLTKPPLVPGFFDIEYLGSAPYFHLCSRVEGMVMDLFSYFAQCSIGFLKNS